MIGEALSFDSLLENQVKQVRTRINFGGPFKTALKVSLDAVESAGILNGKGDRRIEIEDRALNLFEENETGEYGEVVWLKKMGYAKMCFLANEDNTSCEVVVEPISEPLQEVIDTKFLERFEKIYSNAELAASDAFKQCQTSLSEVVFDENLGPLSKISQRKINSMLISYGYERVKGKRSLRKHIVSNDRIREIGSGRSVFMKDGVIFVPSVKNGEVKITGHAPRAKAENGFVEKLTGKQKDYGGLARKSLFSKISEVIFEQFHSERMNQSFDELIKAALIKLGVSTRRSKTLANKILTMYTYDQRNA